MANARDDDTPTRTAAAFLAERAATPPTLEPGRGRSDRVEVVGDLVDVLVVDRRAQVRWSPSVYLYAVTFESETIFVEAAALKRLAFAVLEHLATDLRGRPRPEAEAA